MKIGNIAAKVGTYTDREGNQKGEYENIGQLHEGKDGGYFILLNATALTMQLNMLTNKERKKSVMFSVFEDEKKERAPKQQEAPAPDEDLPF